LSDTTQSVDFSMEQRASGGGDGSGGCSLVQSRSRHGGHLLGIAVILFAVTRWRRWHSLAARRNSQAGAQILGT
jgi:hypothetical protein